MEQDSLNNHKKTSHHKDDAAFHDLFQLIEEQPTVSQEHYQRVKSGVELEWQAMLAKRSGSQTGMFGKFGLQQYQAIAASLILMVGAWFLHGSMQVNPVAVVEVVVGEVRLLDTSSEEMFSAVSEIGVQLFSGDSIETGAEAGLGLRLVDGQSLRLDVNSRLKLISANKYLLKRGAVYFDSDNSSAPPIVVQTPFGIARDIGTQFEIRVLEKSLRLRVREGQVNLKTKKLLSKEFHVERGDELTLNATGAVSQTKVLPFDDKAWEWTGKLAPAFELEGQSLDKFLHWIARENGWELSYQHDRLEFYAKLNVLHGSIDGMYKEDALAAVSISGGVEYELQQGRLSITNRI